MTWQKRRTKNLMRKNMPLEREFSQTQELIKIKKMKHQELVEIKKMEIEELIHVKREKLQTKELEITMMDTTNLDPKQLTIH